MSPLFNSALALTLFITFSLQAHSASIKALGGLDGTNIFSEAIGISADGTTVLGQSDTASGTEGFIYQNDQLTGVGYFGGGDFSSLAASSSDGNIAVGTSGTLFVDETAVVYQSGQLSSLSGIPFSVFASFSLDVSADGSTVVGYSFSNGIDFSIEHEAFISQNGQFTSLGHLSGGEVSEAYAVSADGSIVVGYSDKDTFSDEAFVYQNGQMTGLGYLSGGGFVSQANGISADGSYIVGISDSSSGDEGFVHHNGQMIALGDLAGGSFFSKAYDVSSNGNIIVGYGSTSSGEEAAVWEADGNGGYTVINLQQKLLALGVDITQDGWTQLFEARAISDDGVFVAGTGERNGNTEAFLVDLTESEVMNVPLPVWAQLLLGLIMVGIVVIRKKV